MTSLTQTNRRTRICTYMRTRLPTSAKIFARARKVVADQAQILRMPCSLLTAPALP